MDIQWSLFGGTAGDRTLTICYTLLEIILPQVRLIIQPHGLIIVLNQGCAVCKSLIYEYCVACTMLYLPD